MNVTLCEEKNLGKLNFVSYSKNFIFKKFVLSEQ